MSSALAFLALLSPLAQAAVPAIPGFSVQWSEDFTGAAGSLPDSANWILTTGTSYPGGAPQFGTWEVETYTDNPDNVQTDGQGHLQITAIKNGDAWTSSRIETKRTDFMAPAGGKMRIQASLNLPEVENPIGYWPAFWTLGAKFRGVFTNWPGVGEFDIMENVNGLNMVAGTLHCGTAPGGPCNENDGIGGNMTGDADRPLQGNFHEYTLEVDRATEGAGCLRWFLDGQQYHEVQQAQVEPTAWKDAVEVPHFLLLNLAIGGSFPNKVFNATTPLADTTSGGVYQADYVAVYYSAGAGGGGRIPPPSSSSTTSSPVPSATSGRLPPTPPPRARRHAGPAVRRMQ